MGLLAELYHNIILYSRWGFTPVADAKRFGHEKVVKILEHAMDNYNADDKIDRRFQTIDSTKYGEITFKRDNTYTGDTTMKLDKTKFIDDNDVIYNIDCVDDELQASTTEHKDTADVEAKQDQVSGNMDEYSDKVKDGLDINDDNTIKTKDISEKENDGKVNKKKDDENDFGKVW